MAWKTSEGILLMGGNKPSLLIKPDGTVEERFQLSHHTSRACAVPDDRTNSVYILGGYFRGEAFSIVKRYEETGPTDDFIPNMNYKRASLGCAGYYDNDNKVTI